MDWHQHQIKIKNSVDIQSLTSRNAMEKYISKNRGVIFSICFNLSDWGIFIAACSVAAIVGLVQCLSWNTQKVHCLPIYNHYNHKIHLKSNKETKLKPHDSEVVEHVNEDKISMAVSIFFSFFFCQKIFLSVNPERLSYLQLRQPDLVAIKTEMTKGHTKEFQQRKMNEKNI